MNRSVRDCLAFARTRSSPLDTIARLCIRFVVVSPVFPLASPLGSADSHCGHPLWFLDILATGMEGPLSRGLRFVVKVFSLYSSGL